MQETPKKYTSRLFGYVQGREPLRVLRATCGRIERLLGKVPAKKLLRRPGDGLWSIGEILIHLAQAELVFAYRVRMILSATGTPIQAYDQNIWQANARDLRRHSSDAFALFCTLRKGDLSLLQTLTKGEWDRFGMHEERGKESIKHLTRLMAGHDENHLRQIQRIVNND